MRTRRSLFRTVCLVGLAMLFCGLSTVEAMAQAPAIPPGPGPLTLCQPQVVGNRRIQRENVLARVYSHQGDLYDPATVNRDFDSLWNTGYFEKISIELTRTAQCAQLVYYVTEKPTIREIYYSRGMTTISQSDVLDRFKKEKVGVSIESQFDMTKVQHAATVIKEMLSEHGHQFATVTPEIRTIPPASVALTFNVKEGPTVKVGKIEFSGNEHLSHSDLQLAMRNLRPYGIPHSLILEDLISKTFDSSKLDEDAERVELEYKKHGYFTARTGQAVTQTRDEGGINPFTLHARTGKRVDILIPVQEGQRYRLGSITFSGGTIGNPAGLRAAFPIKDGDWLDTSLILKGMDNLKKAYTARGFIKFVPTPIQTIDDAKQVVNIVMQLDEGKAYYVSRIEFSGNTITRDKVIRRELLLQEGSLYNSQMWDLSLLRLNQLSYFEPLKAEQDSESHEDDDNQTVDLLLKLKEKGKQSIGLNGGLSGLSGAFLGTNYETNNFLGLGETLSVSANIGDLTRNLQFGFTEPYLHDKPISVGLQVYSSKYDYNPAKSYAISQGQSANLTNAQQSLLTNYNQSSTGLTLTMNEPFRKLFATKGVARFGVSYSLSRSCVWVFYDYTRFIFLSLAFRTGFSGSSQLDGIITSVLTPSFTLSSLDRGIGPHSGKDLTASIQIAGAGGNVKYILPAFTFRQYFPMKGLKLNREGHQVLGYRIQFVHVEGYGGEVAPPMSRIYGGGENDVRGFDIRASSPYTFIPNKVLFNLTNPDNSTVPRDPTNPNLGNVQIPLPVYRLVSIGGDTGLTSNLQYSIPIVQQITLSIFTDFGLTGNLLDGQLRQNVLGADAVTSPSYGCPQLINGACFGGQKVDFPFLLKTVPHTNFVPRMSNGIEIGGMVPIINAPLRLYYAYNPLRLYRDLPQQLAVPNSTFQSMFPDSGAGRFTYLQALQLYGADYQLREPRKTIRLTVSTTF